MELLVFIAAKSGGMGLFSPRYTAQNTEILPNFWVWKFCGNAQFSQKKPCDSTKFPHHEIR